jgi:hypothetical protein
MPYKMKVLKATQNQYNLLNGFSNKNHVLKFEKDANDNWIVGTAVLENDNFLEIKEQLTKLFLIDYNPKIVI